jgi:hypothetical protein
VTPSGLSRKPWNYHSSRVRALYFLDRYARTLQRERCRGSEEDVSQRNKRQGCERADHLMDASRYLIMSGLGIMARNTAPERQPQYTYDFAKDMGQKWMQ